MHELIVGAAKVSGLNLEIFGCSSVCRYQFWSKHETDGTLEMSVKRSSELYHMPCHFLYIKSTCFVGSGKLKMCDRHCPLYCPLYFSPF